MIGVGEKRLVMIERFGLKFYEPSDISLIKERLAKYPVTHFEAITAYYSEASGSILYSINIEGDKQRWFLEDELVTYLQNNGLWLDTSGYSPAQIEAALRAEAEKRAQEGG